MLPAPTAALVVHLASCCLCGVPGLPFGELHCCCPGRERKHLMCSPSRSRFPAPLRHFHRFFWRPERAGGRERLRAGCCAGARGLNPCGLAFEEQGFSARTLWRIAGLWLSGRFPARATSWVKGSQKIEAGGLVPLKGAGEETQSLKHMSRAGQWGRGGLVKAFWSPADAARQRAAVRCLQTEGAMCARESSAGGQPGAQKACETRTEWFFGQRTLCTPHPHPKD